MACTTMPRWLCGGLHNARSSASSSRARPWKPYAGGGGNGPYSGPCSSRCRAGGRKPRRRRASAGVGAADQAGELGGIVAIVRGVGEVDPEQAVEVGRQLQPTQA
jgi:hypothetical protein